MAEAPEFVDFEVEADFENAKEFGGGFSLVPPGKYIVEVDNVQQKTAKSSNNPMVTVTFKVSEGQEDDEAAKQTGRLIFNNYSLSEKAIGRLKNLMMACGAPLDKFRASAIMGAKIRAEVIHSQGKDDVGPDGKAREGGTFANIVNEKPLDEAPAEAAPPPPPAAKAATNGKATTATPASKPPAAGATRRA